MDEEDVMWRADSYQKIKIKRCFPQEEKKSENSLFSPGNFHVNFTFNP